MGKAMLTVVIRENESFDKAVRRFQTECKKAGMEHSTNFKAIR